MFFKKNQKKHVLMRFLKILIFILGLDIFLTSLFIIIKKEYEIKNLESKNFLDFKKLNYDQRDQFNIDIY